MPKIHLTPSFVKSPPLPEKTKLDYFDTEVPGLLLEVRKTGKCTYYQRYRDKYGKLKQVRIGPVDSISLDKARQTGKEIRSRSIMGFDPRAEEQKQKAMPTFKQFVEEYYLPYIKLHKRSHDTDRRIIYNRLVPMWKDKRMGEISSQEIEEFVNTFIRLGYKPATANRSLMVVKHIFRLARQWGIIDESPAADVSELKVNNSKERFLSDQECKLLLQELEKCPNPVVRDLIEFLMLTGARKTEAATARWPDMDLERQMWTIPLSKSGQVRHVPLSSAAVNVLFRRPRLDISDYIFANPQTGKPVRQFHFAWDKIRKSAGIPDVRLHDLRHNFASMLINSGRSLYEVQKLLGHYSIQTTQRYAHLKQDTLKEAIEVVPNSLGSDDNSDTN